MTAPSIWSCSFVDVFDEWDRLTASGQNADAVKALCVWDRYYLLVQILGRKDLLHPWLYERCREVERRPDGFLDLWAREHYKSTIITFAGTIQEILRNPEITIGIFSHTAPIAKSFLRQIRNELERNERLKALFPEILFREPQHEASSWSLDNGIIVRRTTNPKEATVEAHGLVDGQPTSKHFSLLIYDDVVVKESVSTPEQVAKTTEAWEISTNLGVQNGRKWHIGTRWSYADTYGEIIKRGAVIPRLYPSTSDGTWDGEPVFWSVDENERRKVEQGEATYSVQNLQNPLAGRQRMFDTTDLRIYEIRPATLSIYIMCDPARSKKRDSANTAMVVLGVDYNLNKYLLDGFNHRMDLQDRWRNFSRLWMQWHNAPGVCGIRMGYESFGAQADLDYFKEQMRKLDQPRFEIAMLEWPREGDGSKIDRVQRLGPDIRSHKVFLPHSTDPKKMTAAQREIIHQGLSYRISKSIRKVDETGKIYDLSEQFRTQLHYFPYGNLKDIVDAASRIYDMEPIAPRRGELAYAEPEFI